MSMPMEGGQMPATIHEVSMSEGGQVSPADCGAACEMAVDSAVSHREQTGRQAGM